MPVARHLLRLIQAVVTAPLVAGLWVTGWSSATAAASAVVKTDQVRAELLAHAPQGVAPGQPLWLGLKLEHQPHWHTYWKNPGDSGLPTTLTWTLPPGFVAADIAWPTPQPLPVGPLMNFGYEGTVLLPVAVTVPPAFQGPTLVVRLDAQWLVCKEVCIPESGEFRLELPTRAATATHTALFEAAQAAVPRALGATPASARVEGQQLVVQVSGLPSAWQGQTLRVFPELGELIDHAAPHTGRWEGANWVAQLPLSGQRTQSPTRLGVVLAAPSGGAGVQVDLPVSGTWPRASVAAGAAAGARAESSGPTTANASTGAAGLVWTLLLALIGGSLLNFMPCVFPVLSLKVIAVAAQGSDRRALAAGGMAYTAGVVLSFLGLASLLLVLRAGGEQLGWGFQLQSPGFVVALATLFTVIGWNLAGLFEFGGVLPGNLAGWRAHHPVVDAAWTGVVAVAIASPCTAPFMGASLGLAVTLPTVQALLVFAALGLGMAAPYLLACLWPAWTRILPRPGAWMIRFKTLMAFPMFATVVWLCWVLGQQAGVDAIAGLLGLLVAVTALAWAWGLSGLSARGRAVAIGLAGVGVALTAWWAAPAWTGDPPEAGAAAHGVAGAGSTPVQGLSWAPWSAARVQESLDQGRPVFVDFTAAWCVTCQFNKRTTLADPQVLADFAARRVVLLRADWTRRDAAITAALARLGRSGVPVYVLMSPGQTEPRVLSELLSVREVREALAALPGAP